MPLWLAWLIEAAGSLLRALVGAKQASAPSRPRDNAGHYSYLRVV